MAEKYHAMYKKISFIGLIAMAALSTMSLTTAPTITEEPAEVNYTKYCASCHGEKVEAFVDRKWKHGDKKADILNSITHGYPDLGMPTWKEVLTPKEIEKLADLIVENLAGVEQYKFANKPTSNIFKSDGMTIALDTIVTGLDSPWGFVQLPSNDYLITDRAGVLYKVDQKRNKTAITGTPAVYAQGQGNIVIGGSRAATGGAATSVNHLNAGRIPSGGLIEKAVPSLLADEFIQLDLHRADFSLMQRTAETIGKRFGLGTALPVDARTLNVRVPVEPLRRTAFMAALQDLDVPMVSGPARVILNSRTGSVVMNQAVQLSPSAVAHGNLTVKVQQTPTTSQPLPFSRGQTTVTTQDTATISDSGKENSLISVPSGASLDQVVKALNMMGATPQDLISILQSLKSAGALRAELEVI